MLTVRVCAIRCTPPGNERLDDELGVAVVFDEEEDDEPEGRDARGDQDAIVGEDISDEEEADVGLDASAPRRLARGEDEEGGEGGGEGGEDELPVGTIDAYWLQRECGKYFGDPIVAQKVGPRASARPCATRAVPARA